MRQANILRCWAGIEGQMPDNLPVIGPGSQQGIYHIFGFSAHGFALAPIAGQIIADLIKDGASGFSIDSFSADRF